jgi:hypothetical protein
MDDDEEALLPRPWAPSFDEDLVRKQIPSTDSADVDQTIIRAHLWTEHFLIRLIEAGVARPASLDMDRMSFGTKVQIACAVGLLPDNLAKSLMILNALRNKVAHKLDYKFSDADKRDVFYSLPTELQSMILGDKTFDATSFPVILRCTVYLLDSIRHSRQEHARIAKERLAQMRKKHGKAIRRAYESVGEKPPDWD